MGTFSIYVYVVCHGLCRLYIVLHRAHVSLTMTALVGVNSLYPPFISIDSCLDRVGSEFFGLCMYGLTSSSIIFAKVVRERIDVYRACLVPITVSTPTL